MSVAEYFQLDADEAIRLAGEVGDAVSASRAEAARRGISGAECERMASAFSHSDVELARSFV